MQLINVVNNINRSEWSIWWWNW